MKKIILLLMSVLIVSGCTDSDTEHADEDAQMRSDLGGYKTNLSICQDALDLSEGNCSDYALLQAECNDYCKNGAYLLNFKKAYRPERTFQCITACGAKYSPWIMAKCGGVGE